MFLETAIAIGVTGFALGALTGIVYAWLVAIRPEDQRKAQTERDALRQIRRRIYAAEAQRIHQGTPYIRTATPRTATLPADVDMLVAAVDNQRWSRKNPLEVVR